MNNIGKNVDSMNFEELRSFVKVLANDVQELSDLYAKTKREYNDMLYNLSRDNLSIEYIIEQESMFEQTENGLKSVIAKNIASLRKLTDEEKENATPVNSFEEMTDKSLIYKMPLTDNPNKFTYFCYYAPLDMWVPINEVDQQKYSTIEQTAEKIATSVSETKQYVDEKLGDVELTNYTTIEQTADSIKTIAAKQVNLKNAIEVKEITNQLDEKEIYKTCEYSSDGKITSETYYYYDELGNEWIPFQADNIYTVFEQTAEGFKFKGNVIIDGDLCVLRNIRADRLYSRDYPNGYYMKIYGEFGDFGIFSPDAATNGNFSQGCILGAYNNLAEAILVINSQNVMAVDSDEVRAMNKKWNFSGVDVEGIGVVPVFG